MPRIPPDWDAILNEQGPFSTHEIACADEWPTCAIGEAAHHFPDRVLVDPECCQSPYDARLYHLGRAFADAVGMHDRREARRLYAQIQDRVSALRVPQS